jgi:signal transduction histidine kinase
MERVSNREGKTGARFFPSVVVMSGRDGRMMHTSPATKVAIVGAGRGGTSLLELFHQIPSIEIVGIVDRDPQAPGLQRARELHVPVVDKVSSLIGNPQVNLIVDVTGDPEMERYIAGHKEPRAEIVSGSVSRLLWELVQYETRLHTKLFHAEKLAGIGSFAAGIAHDINNPLQLILGLAENLVDEQDPAVIREQTKDIIEAVKRTSVICHDLTQYARRSSVRADAVVCLNGRLDEALKIARYATSCHDINVVKAYAPGAAVRGNPDEVLHIFVNLITNAVHAMEQGGGMLTLSTGMTENGAEIAITDTGCGIAPEAMGQIFEPFYTTKAVGKGTGLGLYNVKTVVGKMHGTIAVESEIDHGTTFTLRFPKSDPRTSPGDGAP